MVTVAEHLQWGKPFEPAKKPPRRTAFWDAFIPISLFSAFANRVLHIAQGVVSRSLRLIELAFGLQFLVSGDFASSVFNGAFGLVSGSLNVFAVHAETPDLFFD